MICSFIADIEMTMDVRVKRKLNIPKRACQTPRGGAMCPPLEAVVKETYYYFIFKSCKNFWGCKWNICGMFLFKIPSYVLIFLSFLSSIFLFLVAALQGGVSWSAFFKSVLQLCTTHFKDAANPAWCEDCLALWCKSEPLRNEKPSDLDQPERWQGCYATFFSVDCVSSQVHALQRILSTPLIIWPL